MLSLDRIRFTLDRRCFLLFNLTNYRKCIQTELTGLVRGQVRHENRTEMKTNKTLSQEVSGTYNSLGEKDVLELQIRDVQIVK